MTSVEIEENKRHASFERETAIATKKISSDEIAITFRWIMASLLAINSAGLAASISIIKNFDYWQLSSTAFFVVGVLLSLKVGWSLLDGHSFLLKPTGDLIVFWTMAAIDGKIDVDEFRTLAEKANSSIPKYGEPRKFARLSLLAFVMAVICVAVSHTSPPQKKSSPPVEVTK